MSTLIQTSDADAKKTVEDLLAGKCFTAPIDEQVVFNQLNGNTNAIWSLLAQIEEKQYEATLIAGGFEPENIRKYGFGFRGQNCLIE